ncbi:AAA family ATPase [Zooshikella marina]|uniref:chloramphenicol phosphotransferase CPT family protein n=1 Tax=Zooshikella ganghwensis TaxID=202772 RepID=UPI001BAF9A25|nr:AAA family ATPase [Zooshikella ganghwensis]MBU2708070.1 AAA family ATPase [Zooshikella ganghwensis]
MDILFLNGTTCSGKSSIASELQAILPDYYLHIGIDHFIAMMPSKSNDLEGSEKKDGFYWRETLLPDNTTGYQIQQGPYGIKVNDAYRKTVANLVRNGLRLIVDDITNGESEMKIWRSVLAPYSTAYIAVYCNLDTLEEREKNRKNRKQYTAREQFYRVHQDIKYDFSVNTTKTSTEACAKTIAQFIRNSSLIEDIS